MFCFGTDAGSRKGLNLAANSRLVVHLESGDDVVILEGNAEPARDQAFLERADEAYAAKYDGVRLITAPGQAYVLLLKPTTALAWRERDFPATATRWTFGLG